ncbi:phytosulfokines-like [Corylus avellana]|uniref:phytosulfokines-like n=1 Tax=Corylus avellana TaxID=13451 RepID=UPI00286C086E|nr:phytosulfokines-like [Corylus avellana]
MSSVPQTLLERKKMSSKVSTLCMVALLLLYTLTSATARPEPVFSGITPMKTQHGDVEVEKAMEEESCEGVGEEECLNRRTLAAHLDYIYTQKHKP